MAAEFRTMGVVNLTPDSFSDGGLAATPGGMRARVASLLSLGVDLLDFGAQSTAPGSRPVGADAELERFEVLLGEFPDLALGGAGISIDTFRPGTFSHVHERLRNMGFRGVMMWNDVSGVVDDDTVHLLRALPEVRYVLAHTLVPTKTETPRHPEFAGPSLDAGAVVARLREGASRLAWMPARLLLDPAFGFSKTPEQSLGLLRDLGSVLRPFGPGAEWVFGLSRKSVLRALFPDDRDLFGCELAHVLALDRVLSLRPRAVLRVHDPRVVLALAAARAALGPPAPDAPAPAVPDRPRRADDLPGWLQ